MPDLRKLKVISIGLVAVALLLAGSFQLAAAPADKAKRVPPAQSKQDKDPAQYLGSETCKGCHEDIYKKFETTPHYKTLLDTKRGPVWQGCESCHGAGTEHVTSGGDKTKIFNFGKSVKSEQITERCMECHQYTEEHSNYARSAHNTNQVSCTSCHSIHKAKVKDFLLTDKQPQLCYTCHLETKPEFSRPFRHRVNEGLIKCSDCHNQHGGFLARSVRATAAQDAVCFKCHVDKAGPFVFEHAVIKTEGCISCHVPHGSSNPRLLKRAQVNLLCLECHTLTGGGVAPIGPSHDQSQKYVACTICHVQIHGSNLSYVFFK